MAGDGPGLDGLKRALNPLNPANPQGDHYLAVNGTVNIIGGGAGGVSQTDNTSFVPGSNSLTPIGAYFGPRTVASGRIAAPAINGSAVLQVDVISGGAGGGNANITLRGTANNDLHVGVASGPAGLDGNYALPVIFGSGFYPTVNVGGVQGTFIMGNIPTVNLGLGTVNIGNGLSGTVTLGVTPTVFLGNIPTVNLGQPITATVNLGNIPTVNLGLGTVNVGNVVLATNGSSAQYIGQVGGSVNITGTVLLGAVATVNLGGGTVNIGNVPKVDYRATLTPTTWPLQQGSGLAVWASAPGAGAIKVHSMMLVANATVDLQIQSPSGTNLTGSVRLLPGAGFALAAPIGTPVLVAPVTSALLVNTSAAGVGGWATGVVE